jgi:hypothetical protein
MIVPDFGEPGHAAQRCPDGHLGILVMRRPGVPDEHLRP